MQVIAGPARQHELDLYEDFIVHHKWHSNDTAPVSQKYFAEKRYSPPIVACVKFIFLEVKLNMFANLEAKREE